MNADQTKSKRDGFKMDLYNIAGPRQTWNLKKSLRRRVQLMRDQIRFAKDAGTRSDTEGPQEVWVPLLAHEVDIGDRFCIASDC